MTPTDLEVMDCQVCGDKVEELRRCMNRFNGILMCNSCAQDVDAFMNVINERTTVFSNNARLADVLKFLALKVSKGGTL
jgi:hypothetical protein